MQRCDFAVSRRSEIAGPSHITHVTASVCIAVQLNLIRGRAAPTFASVVLLQLLLLILSESFVRQI